MNGVILPEFGWVKAALHTHSTRSDGRLSPEKVVEFYANAGFGVVALTDHGKVTKARFKEGLAMSGVELDVASTTSKARYHLVIVGLDSLPPENARRNIEDLLAWCKDNDFFAFIAHPYWSSLCGRDLVDVEGYVGVEVYNHGCEVEISRGYSGPHWDYALSKGVFSYGLAVDDAHAYSVDALGGWVELDVPSSDDEESVLKALKEGRFYSSSGLRVYRYEVARDRIQIETSGAAIIKLVSASAKGAYLSTSLLRKIASDENLPIEVEIWTDGPVEKFKLRSRELVVEGALKQGLFTELEVRGQLPARRYVRIELLDQQGHAAWLNPLRL